jgi:hypothetical protein
MAKIVGLNMPPAAPDILSCDGKNVYLRSQAFDLEGNRREIFATGLARPDVPLDKLTPHLFSPSGFLDGTWFHRAYWVYGKGFDSGAGGWPKAGHLTPAGGILAVSDSAVVGYGRKTRYYNWTTPVEYQLFSARKEGTPTSLPSGGWAQLDPTSQPNIDWPMSKITGVKYDWSQDVPILVRALVQADQTLFVAGPPKLVDEPEAFAKQGDPQMLARLAQQAGALEGKAGGLLWAVSAKDGAKLAEYKLGSVPVFDGMICANGRLFVATKDGKVLCIGAK